MNDLAVVQVGRELILRFRAPQLAADGRALTKPLAVDIFRKVAPRGAVQPKAFTAAKPWVILNPQNLARIERGGEITYQDDLSPQEFSRSTGSVFSFMVVTLTRGFHGHPRRSDPSNIAQTAILDVAAPVNRVQVVQMPQALVLQWSAPQQSLSGTPLHALLGYRVYRSMEAKPGAFTLIGQTRSPVYRDTHFHFGTTYLYKVRAIFSLDGYTAETADSIPVEITPRPVFPPPAPQGLTAVFTGKAVELIWEPDVEPDIAGYNVYRQAAGEPARRLNQQLLRTPVFTDSAVAAGARYNYWVTALDLENNESKASSEASVDTR
ncbi:MAG: fibronectin type III domain-containing protein [Terriglobia bacterium]